MFSRRKYEKIGLLVVELAIMVAKKNIWCILEWRIIRKQQRGQKCCVLINYFIWGQRQRQINSKFMLYIS